MHQKRIQKRNIWQEKMPNASKRLLQWSEYITILVNEMNVQTASSGLKKQYQEASWSPPEAVNRITKLA